MSPFTDWDAVPLVCSKTIAARVLNTSTRTIDRELKRGTMYPRPMPKVGNRYQWSKAILKQYVEGGYQTVRRGR